VKAVVLALAALALAASATPTRLPPVEQCDADPSFVQFRAELLSVIGRKDEKALMGLVADDVLVDFGGGNDKKAFAATWGFGRAQPSNLWEKLGEALRLGCAPAAEALVSPSLIAQFPDDLDGYETLVALPGTQLRTKPDDAAASVAVLDWDVLTVVDPVDLAPWSGVRLADGRKGFVRGDQVRSPIDYRAIFEKRGGKWLLTAFVAGD
jgi:hypothetical protein